MVLHSRPDVKPECGRAFQHQGTWANKACTNLVLAPVIRRVLTSFKRALNEDSVPENASGSRNTLSAVRSVFIHLAE